MIKEQDAKAMIFDRLEHRCQKEREFLFLSSEILTPAEARQRYGGKFVGVPVDAILEAVEVQYALRMRATTTLAWENWEIRKDLVIAFTSRPLLLE